MIVCLKLTAFFIIPFDINANQGNWFLVPFGV